MFCYREICEAPPLQGFDINLKCVVTTDASGRGIGSVFTQVESTGKEVTIAFASRSLTATEEKYSVIEREALACVWGLEHFLQYIWGKEVTLRCDHKPLTKVLTVKGLYNASPRLARLSVRLLDYNYEVQYLPGAKNVVADFLSRLPLPNCEDIGGKKEEHYVASINEEFPSIHRDVWLREYLKDVNLQEVQKFIIDGWPIKKSIRREFRAFWELRNELSVEGNLILRQGKLIPPIALRDNILSICFEGHLGINKTKQRINCWYWWPG